MIEFGGMDMLMMAGGFVGGVFKKAMDNSHDFKMKALEKEREERSESRNSTDDFFKWTRRVIALSLTFVICFGPTLAMYLGLPVHVAYYEANGMLWSIFTGDTDLVWKTLSPGFVITPVMVYSFEAVTSFYFGSGGPKR